MSKYKDDLLFFLFYTNVGDAMQLAAAVELYVTSIITFFPFDTGHIRFH